MCASTDRRSTSTDRGTTRRRTAMSGIRASSRRGGRTTTAGGATRDAMAGRLLPATRGAGPTHHYGRWGLSAAGAWFWIPSAGWGAAWVNWAVAPGYVGWCPLGWNNRPVRRLLGTRQPVGVLRRPAASTTTRGARGRSCRPNPSGAGRRFTTSASMRDSSPGRGRPHFVVQPTPPVGGDPARFGRCARLSRGGPVGGAARRAIAARRAAGGAELDAIARLRRAAFRRAASSLHTTSEPRGAARGDLSPGHAERPASGSSGPSAYERAGRRRATRPASGPDRRTGLLARIPAATDDRRRHPRLTAATRRRTRAGGRRTPPTRAARVRPITPTTRCRAAAIGPRPAAIPRARRPPASSACPAIRAPESPRHARRRSRQRAAGRVAASHPTVGASPPREGSVPRGQGAPAALRPVGAAGRLRRAPRSRDDARPVTE